MGYWVDMRAPLPHDGRRRTSSRSGGRSSRSTTRVCSSRTTGSRRTARAAAPGSPTTSSPRATRPSPTRRVYVRFPLTCGPYAGRPRCWCGRRRPGRWSPTPRSRSTRRRLRRRRATATETLVVAEPLLEQVLGEGWTVEETGHGRRHGRLDLPAAVRAGRVPAERGRPRALRRRSPTTSPPRTAPGWCTSPPRSARTTCAVVPALRRCRWSTRSAATATSRTTSPLVGGQFFKHADADLVDDLDRARAAVPARRLRAQLPALLALPHRAALLRAAVLVRPHHPGQGRAARARTSGPTGTPRPSSTAATATG